MSEIDLDALFKVQYGMYIVSSVKDGQYNGQIATVVSQVTCEPIKVITCISKNTLTHEYIVDSELFGVTVLEQATPMKFLGQFGFKRGRDINKFEGVDYTVDEAGIPLVTTHGLVILSARVTQTVDVGTHDLFVGDLLTSEQIAPGEAMTYEYYHTVIRGKSPPNAPTFRVSTHTLRAK